MGLYHVSPFLNSLFELFSSYKIIIFFGHCDCVVQGLLENVSMMLSYSNSLVPPNLKIIQNAFKM